MTRFMNVPETLSRSILVSMLGLSALLVACSDEGATGSGGGSSASASSSGDSSSDSGSASASGSGDSSGSGGAVTPELRVIKQFTTGTTAELPDGLAITPDGKTAYVGFVATGKIVKVSLPDGEVSAFGGLTVLPPSGVLLGLILDANGNLFAGVSGVAKAGAGVYRIDKSGGVATLFVDDLQMSLPNGFGFMADGSLLVTDSAKGVVFKIDLKSKQVVPWAADPLLLGDAATPPSKCADGFPTVPVGANGITSIGTAVFVTNSDSGKIIQIPINFDGTAGKATELVKSDATSCAPLKGADGVAADENGDLYLVGNTGNSFLRLPKGSTTPETLIENDVRLDFPTSVVISTLNGKRYAYLTSFSIDSKANPALLAYGPLP